MFLLPLYSQFLISDKELRVPKTSREQVLRAALDLLNDEGLDRLSTRRLAQRLGIESPALYWHFKNKAELLSAMAQEISNVGHNVPIPKGTRGWRLWFAENARTFRLSLLAYRDGARVHAGTRPSENDLARITPKVTYLIRVGFSRDDALTALYIGGQYTLGSVLEEQARSAYLTEGNESTSALPKKVREVSEAMTMSFHNGAESAFEFGLQLLIDGLDALRLRTREAKR